MKYKDWLNDWLKLYVKPTTKARTYEKYKRQIEIHILPMLGDYELDDLKSIVLQRFTVDLSENTFLETIDWAEIDDKSDEECKEISDRLISTSHRYDLARLLYKSERLRKYRTIFTNLLISLTHFDNETDNLFSNLNRELKNTFNNPALKMYIINNKQNELRNYIIKYYALTILEPRLVKTFEIYKLLTSDSYSVKAYMEKCDAIRSTHGTYPNTLEDAKKTQNDTMTKTTSPTTSSYTPSSSSSETKGKIVCGVLSALAFLIMIICFGCEALVGGVIFGIGGVALLVGAAGYEDIKGNGKALTAIILIPIILCCILCPIVGNATSSSNTTNKKDQNSTYTITLNKDGGSGGTSKVYVEYGDSMPCATAPSKRGYKFGGYYTSRNGGGIQYYTASMSSARRWNKLSNITLYAYWIKDR